MSFLKIKEVIVVEGRNDTVAIQRAVQADTIETRGSAIGESVLAEIKRAQAKRGVIVFTDPDHAGERIRRIVAQAVPEVKHAFLPQALARGKRKIGIEHATPEAIVQALQQVRTERVLTKPIHTEQNVTEQVEGLHRAEETELSLSWKDYIELGFVGRDDSGEYRQKVADRLGIGYGNAKQFFRRLQVLRISPMELYQAMKGVEEDERTKTDLSPHA